MSGVVLGGVVEVVGSNLARSEEFTASIGSDESPRMLCNSFKFRLDIKKKRFIKAHTICFFIMLFYLTLRLLVSPADNFRKQSVWSGSKLFDCDHRQQSFRHLRTILPVYNLF